MFQLCQFRSGCIMYEYKFMYSYTCVVDFQLKRLVTEGSNNVIRHVSLAYFAAGLLLCRQCSFNLGQPH